MRSLGADHVIDYTKTDFARTGQRYDLIFDAIGNRSVDDYRRALIPAGRCVVAGFTTLPLVFQVLLFGTWGGAQIASFLAQLNQPDLLVLKALLESGKIVPVIDRSYPLAQTADAIRYLETSRARGKVIITMEANN